MESPLYSRHKKLGAHFIQRDGVAVPRDYGDARAEYAALRDDAGALDLANCGVLRVEGNERATWLHKLVTTDIEALAEGAGAFGLLLEAKGHVVADFVVVRETEAFTLYTSIAAKENLFINLRRAIFRAQVTLRDVTERMTVVSLQGARAQAIVEKIFDMPAPRARFHFISPSFATFQIRMIRNPRAGADGFDFLAPREAMPALWDALIAHGARAVGFDALNAARIERGIAWYGDDYDESTLAPEAHLDQFIALDKGCYTGQEVIARIRNLGHVNRWLVQLILESKTVPARGDLVSVDGKIIGTITSSAWSYAHNAPLALGYLSRLAAQNDALVQITREGKIISAARVKLL